MTDGEKGIPDDKPEMEYAVLIDHLRAIDDTRYAAEIKAQVTAISTRVGLNPIRCDSRG